MKGGGRDGEHPQRVGMEGHQGYNMHDVISVVRIRKGLGTTLELTYSKV